MLNADFEAYKGAMEAGAEGSAPAWYQELSRTLNSRNVTIESWNNMCRVLRAASSNINAMDAFIRKIYDTLPADVKDGDFIIVLDNKLVPIQLETGGKY